MYALLGISIVLAALLTINALATLLASVFWRAIAGRTQNWAAETRARILFALRLFPMLGAIACVLILLAPSYLAHEPTDTNEVVSTKLAVLAIFSAIGIALALWRGFATSRATRLLNADWQRNAVPLQLDGIDIPTYRIRHPFPVIAIVGALRPRLFIATQIFDALNEAEFAAALAHERGHLAMFDNLKRSCLRACRDALTIVPCGRLLDREWAEASEAAADEYAARGGAGVALDLASALVKIARIVPPHTSPKMPALAHLIGEDTSGVVWRVRRLTELAAADWVLRKRRAFSSPLLLWSSLCAFLFILLFTATHSTLLLTMHQAIEQVVSVLS
jgi:Zn-dependent protease with chaperone function